MLELQSVRKRFGETVAVDDVSFSVRKGEIVGFLGPNGAGKTTTMRMIAGFLVPDSGEVLVDGDSVQQERVQAQQVIGYLPENNPLYPDMLVFELLELAAELRGMKRVARKEAYDFVIPAAGLADVVYTPVRELSKGYRQRTGLALALLHQPKLIILDEPTEGLDPNQRGEMRQLIRDLAKERTILMSTHVMQEAAAVATRLLVIKEGKIVADDTPEKLTKYKGGTRAFTVELSGGSVERLLKNLKDVERVDVLRVEGGRVRALLISKGDTDVPQAVSQLIASEKLTIWHMAEEEQQLEDVFAELTKINS